MKYITVVDPSFNVEVYPDAEQVAIALLSGATTADTGKRLSLDAKGGMEATFHDIVEAIEEAAEGIGYQQANMDKLGLPYEGAPGEGIVLMYPVFNTNESWLFRIQVHA